MLILKDQKFKDKTGQKIHFEKPYFDTALRQHFSSINQKAEFMNKHGIVERGDSDAKCRKQRKEHYEKTNDLRRS